jgi:hypothetical protein
MALLSFAKVAELVGVAYLFAMPGFIRWLTRL